MQELKEALQNTSKDLFDIEAKPELTRPEERYGDYATNLAMQLGKRLGKNPKEIAVAIAGKLHGKPGIYEVKIAGPGFINITLTNEKLAETALSATNIEKSQAGKEILVEFGDPNPFKEMHIGHLYSYIVGDSISRLLEAQGATVRRLSYHSDVGLHVAMAIWCMRKEGVDPESIADSLKNNLGWYYARGSVMYKENKSAAAEIEKVNMHIYKRDDDSIIKLYDWGRRESFADFDETLKDLGISTDRRYRESDSAEVGFQLVRANTGKIFKESNGAIIYDGDKIGLHKRVFITSKGLPTYEAKDLGLAELKNKDYPKAAKSIIITANEQVEYFKVMLAALKELDKELAEKTTHLTHGFVTLSTGKMSSRTGEVYSAASLLSDVERQAKKLYPGSLRITHLAAIKYGFLKHRLGGDIVYDVSDSISLEGNSGPYLQYAYARARNILAKSSSHDPTSETGTFEYDKSERSLARKISEYPEVVQRAAEEFMPSHVATYLYELAQSFNRFYEKSRVVGDDRESPRLALVKAYSEVLKNGLGILNIEAPDNL